MTFHIILPGSGMPEDLHYIAPRTLGAVDAANKVEALAQWSLRDARFNAAGSPYAWRLIAIEKEEIDWALFDDIELIIKQKMEDELRTSQSTRLGLLRHRLEADYEPFLTRLRNLRKQLEERNL
jgi:hypothetical protein